MTKVKVVPLLLSLLLCFSAAFVGSLFTYQSIPTWYVSLNKPVFSPPNWIFGPVWTTLYFMMGVSFYLVWQKRSKKVEKRQGLIYFVVQLILNALWSIVFFGLHSPWLALLVIICLWGMIFLTIKSFIKVSKVAGWLLFPYLAWVSFASLLNLFIIILNR